MLDQTIMCYTTLTCFCKTSFALIIVKEFHWLLKMSVSVNDITIHSFDVIYISNLTKYTYFQPDSAQLLNCEILILNLLIALKPGGCYDRTAAVATMKFRNNPIISTRNIAAPRRHEIWR